MTARHKLRRESDGLPRQKNMSSQSQKGPGSKSVTYGPAEQHAYPQFHDVPADVQPPEVKPSGIEVSPSDRYMRFTRPEAESNEDGRSLRSREGYPTHMLCEEVGGLSDVAARMSFEDIPSQLFELVRSMISGLEGEVRADAFISAADLPPITRQSLSELDIQNIINNIKLRHDVNFDRDLSFRPNLDGAKGQEKMKAAKKYWKALTAELDLYARLLHGTPSGDTLGRARWAALINGSKRRIPIMFTTLLDILKNLVPDRDQSRVDEHLDVGMLMQQIERGVCDLIRLSEWLAQLLKEHCAPMRDAWVDDMVQSTRTGVATGNSESIVKGLRELLGILEAMKLDVANHQIRNLRPLLIEDTVQFERTYHLSRIARRRINVEAAQRWYSEESCRVRQRWAIAPLPKDSLRAQLEIFVRATVSRLYSNQDFPETFYLDHERLRMLRSELYDLVYIEICFDTFAWLLKGPLQHFGPISPNARQSLRNSLSAIIADGTAYNSCQWQINREYITLQLVRHALRLCGSAVDYNANLAEQTSHHIQGLFDKVPERAAEMELKILPQVLDCVNRHVHSSPIDLFNALIPTSTPPPPPPPPSYPAPVIQLGIPRDSPIASHPASDQLTDLTHRITHIVLLHWRIWGPIVYVLPEDVEILQLGTAFHPVAEGTLQPVTSQEVASTNAVKSTDSTSTRQSASSRRIAGPAPEASALE